MDARALLLTLPSLAILGLLILHSRRTLAPTRAVSFWCSVAAYAVLRGIALRFVIDRGLGASFPYVIRKPLLPVFGVPLQEIVGWAIVTYIGWWLGTRFSKRLFEQVCWACVFLGAISWVVESTAVGAGWWRWTVPVSHALFMNVPFIGIVDWTFVGTDFLLPFAAITAPELRGRRFRYAFLAAFPLHFAAHCFVKPPIAGVPVPTYHLIHWVLIAVLLWLAMRSATVDLPFRDEGRGRLRAWLPMAAASMILATAAVVDLWIAPAPRLLLALLPVAALVLRTFRPAAGYAAGAVGLIASAWLPALALAAVPAATAATVALGRRYRRWLPAAGLFVLGATAFFAHSAGARGQDDLMRRLHAALAARDRGDLSTAAQSLADLCAEFPNEHAPAALLGELSYRTDRLDEARRRFESAVRIKQDFKEGFRYLAVIDLRQGRNQSAERFAERGLSIDPEDVELNYLSVLARAAPYSLDRFERLDPMRAYSLASLAFEVGDTTRAAAMLDRGLALWPANRAFYSGRVNVAMKEGDAALARRVVVAWRTRFPEDAEARQLSRVLGVE